MTVATAVRERPILFSGPMVRAILDGRKTQTRRVIRVPRDLLSSADHDVMRFDRMQEYPDGETRAVFDYDGEPNYFGLKCPYGEPGDRLWVRETWGEQILDIGDVRQERRFVYRATSERRNGGVVIQDVPSDNGDVTPWRPSIHMPRRVSRLTLEITGVRVERVQDIRHNVSDLEAEGVALSSSELFPHTNRESKLTRVYEKLWDSLNAPRGYGWDVNPWCWVIEFRRVDGVA